MRARLRNDITKKQQQKTAVERPTGREISKERERRDRATTGLDLVSGFWAMMSPVCRKHSGNE